MTVDSQFVWDSARAAARTHGQPCLKCARAVFLLILRVQKMSNPDAHLIVLLVGKQCMAATVREMYAGSMAVWMEGIVQTWMS